MCSPHSSVSFVAASRPPMQAAYGNTLVIEERAELVHVVVVLDEAEPTADGGRTVAPAELVEAVDEDARTA